MGDHKTRRGARRPSSTSRVHGLGPAGTRRVAALMAALALSGCQPSGDARGSSGSASPSPSPSSSTSVPPTPAEGAGASAAPPGPVSHGPRDRRRIALTFDADLTGFMAAELDSGRVRSFDNSAVIDELQASGTPATFFLTGLWANRYPRETRRLLSTPQFEVGSHSYAHIAFRRPCFGLGLLPVRQMAADVRASEQVLRAFGLPFSRRFRFPGGCFDSLALREVSRTGVQVVGYDVASGDAFGTSVTRIVRQTLSAVRPGSIVVFHINGGNTAPLTAKALPAILVGIRRLGLQPVTVSRLLSP